MVRLVIMLLIITVSRNTVYMNSSSQDSYNPNLHQEVALCHFNSNKYQLYLHLSKGMIFCSLWCRSMTGWTGIAVVSHLIQQNSVWRTCCTPSVATPRTCCWFTSWYVSHTVLMLFQKTVKLDLFIPFIP